MARIQLRVYVHPGGAEVFINLKRKDANYERRVAVIDTGAEISLLPNELLEVVDFRPVERGVVIIDQAGIAKQAFTAREGSVTLFLEDQYGNRTEEFDARVWFADASVALIGFDDILERAILHIDMPNRSGWINISPEQLPLKRE